jgi:hypothetical protein
MTLAILKIKIVFELQNLLTRTTRISVNCSRLNYTYNYNDLHNSNNPNKLTGLHDQNNNDNPKCFNNPSNRIHNLEVVLTLITLALIILITLRVLIVTALFATYSPQ